MISLRRIGRTLLAGLLVMGALAGCMEPFGHERRATPTPPAAHQTAAPERSVPPTVAPVPAVLPEVAQSATQWPLANKDYGNTRATKDSQINASNVNQLGLAWTFKLQGASK